MSAMKQVVDHIKEYSCDDGRVEELLRWCINEHIQGRVKFKDLPLEAQLCYGEYEQEQTVMRDADQQSIEWEEMHKQATHDRINKAVNEGSLTYDQGLMLIKDEDKAEQWMTTGVIDA
jgi:hypothetical protein